MKQILSFVTPIFKDVILPDIKFILLANNIISMNLCWLTFTTIVILIQSIHHVWRQTIYFAPLTPISDSIGIIKSILVSVSERQINDTFNDTFHNDILSIKLFWPKSEQVFNKIDVLCLFNYIILKIMCHEQYYQKVNRKKSQQFGCILFLKIKFSFVH